ncbi:hypothetical protein LLG96_04830 [bacterium]|nr:hypothetical protein [bacterium]
MKPVHKIFLFLLVLLCMTAAVRAGVLVTDADMARGRRNLQNPLFSHTLSEDYGLATAVNYLLTGNPAMGDSVKKRVEDALAAAKKNLPQIRGAFSDSASAKLYESLVIYDLVSGANLWDIVGRESIRKSMKQILDTYLQYDIYAWNDDSWCLGATAMRLVASSALYSLNFSDDPDFRHYIDHSKQFLEKNLENSIDDYGAWITDSPEYASYAEEYLIITAKAFKNAKVNDYFSNPRLLKVLEHDMNVLLPQQSPHIRGFIMTAGTGNTVSGSTVVLAAADVSGHAPDVASHLLWFWKQCGQPVDPLVLLFADTSNPESMPEGKSTIAGGGNTVLRYDYGSPDESMVIVNFGSADGVPGRELANHSGDGSLSFIWKGIPLIVHDGSSGSSECAEHGMNDAAWRHNIVTRRGLGDTPVLQDTANFPEPALETTFSGTKIPADFYPEGINQFMTTDMADYVSGKVRLPRSDIPPDSYYRHILFLKPDALLVWDQIESSYPLEWNLRMPVETVGAEDNVLHLLTGYDVDLEAHFPGEGSLDYTAVKPEESTTWDWPLLMRAELGTGTITVSFIDLIADALARGPSCGTDLLRNILSQGREPLLTGMIGESREAVDMLSRLKIPCEILTYKDLSETNLSVYNSLVIGAQTSAGIERALAENSAKIASYVREGGSVLWLTPTPLNWQGQYSGKTSFVPATLVPGTCPVSLSKNDINPASDLKIAEDMVWKKPKELSLKTYAEWITKSIGDSAGTADSGGFSKSRSVYPPAAWSESWKVLASVKTSIPGKTYSNTPQAEWTRIRVRHPASRDFFTLFLPHQLQFYPLEIKSRNPGNIVFTDHTTTWEVQAGKTSWTDANLSVRISTVDGIKAIYAFDCTFADAGDTKFTAQAPMSLYFSPLEGAGKILSPDDNSISTQRVSFKIRAGEVNFYDFKGDVWTGRISFVTRISALDSRNVPVEGVRVYVDGRFSGATGKEGVVPVRWVKKAPVVTVRFGGYEAPVDIVPGTSVVRIPPE